MAEDVAPDEKTANLIATRRDSPPMEVSEAIRVRRSVRSFSDEPVPSDALAKVLEAGRISPSASNKQPWHFIVVTDEGRRRGLSEGRYAKFLTQCPAVIVGCGDRVRAEKWYKVDVTIALQTMVLQATSEGLGTCWIGSFDGPSVRSLLKIPDNYEVVAMLAVGYPKGFSLKDKLTQSTSRMPMEEIVSWEEFGKPKSL